MSIQTHSHLSLKIIMLGTLIAALLYLFHPGVGQFSLLMNGHPVSEPMFRLAALPTLTVAILFVAGLSLLALLGVGMMLFFAALAFVLVGTLVIVPYFWPVLLLFCLVIMIMSPGADIKPK